MSSGMPQGRPTTSRTAALTPSLLAMVGRALCRSGGIVFDLEVTGGWLMMRPASARLRHDRHRRSAFLALHRDRRTDRDPPWTVYRGPRRGVAHLQYAVDPVRPWTGRPHGARPHHGRQLRRRTRAPRRITGRGGGAASAAESLSPAPGPRNQRVGRNPAYRTRRCSRYSTADRIWTASHVVQRPREQTRGHDRPGISTLLMREDSGLEYAAQGDEVERVLCFLVHFHLDRCLSGWVCGTELLRRAADRRRAVRRSACMCCPRRWRGQSRFAWLALLRRRAFGACGCTVRPVSASRAVALVVC